jgi:pimeloyl-ACP methyl ester carboxylesterase
MISGFASTGFVTLLPDYLGFGSSTEVFHPYLHKESTVTCLLDFFRAVKEMGGKSDLQLKLSSDLYLMGYSQGGLSSLQLDQTIESGYSGEFNLKAVGCGASLFNLTQIIDMAVSATTYPQPYYLAYIIKGFKSAAAFSHPYTDIFNEPYASRIDPLFNGINSSSVINNQLTINMAQLFTNEFRTTWNTAAKYKDIRDALTASSVAAWRIRTPLVLTHGLADQNVPAATTQQFYDDLMKFDPSLPVTYIPLDGMDHELAAAPSMLIFMKKFLTIKGN